MVSEVLKPFLTPEVRQVMVLAGIVFALLHVLAVIFIFRQYLTASSLVHTPNGGVVKLMVFAHVIFVIAILLLIIIY